MCDCKEPLLPMEVRIVSIKSETPDIKTFRLSTPEGKKPFDALPGQLGMLSLSGVGEAMFSITRQGDSWLEISVKRTGVLTEALHQAGEGDMAGLRGPYGNGFPVEAFKGRDVLFVGGGVGIAPVRAFINYALENRSDFGHLDILYGSRTVADLAFKEDILEDWPQRQDTSVYLTIDAAQEGWDGHVDFVPTYLEKLAFSPEGKMVVLCGPPVMIGFCLSALDRMGFSHENVYTTLEMRMKCGVGKCGRCNIGHKYVCLDGPVFSQAELDALPGDR